MYTLAIKFSQCVNALKGNIIKVISMLQATIQLQGLVHVPNAQQAIIVQLQPRQYVAWASTAQPVSPHVPHAQQGINAKRQPPQAQRNV